MKNVKNVLSFSEFVNETIDIVSMLDAGTSNFGKGETTKKLKDIEAVLTDPDEWTDDISFKDKLGNVYFIDDLIDKTVKIGNKTITVIEDGMNEGILNGSDLNEAYERPYSIEHKIGDEIELPVLGKCKVVEIGFKPKKTYSNPWLCTGKDFLTFEPQKAFLKTTHKPQSIGPNAIRLETMDRFKDPVIMYQYKENNKVYTQYAYMT